MARPAQSPALTPKDVVTFEGVYREHFPFVWRSLRRLGVPERDLPDVTQEVFAVVGRKLAAFDFENRITTWLYAICIRMASDQRRSARARYEVLSRAGDAPPEVASMPSAEAGQIDERRALLEAALDALPLEQRAVFTLFELEGMSGDDIAALVDVPLATVHSRLRLAREAFRRFLARAKARDDFESQRIGGRK